LPIHEHYPPVVQLAVHLENGQCVYFTEATTITTEELTNRQPPKTTLTEFFILCQQDPFARTLTYPQIPQYYTWNKKWDRRKRGIPDHNHPGIFPNQGECYFIRLLLHEIKGPQSFQDLKTVNGVPSSTYHEACLLLGLIADDNHLHKALSEANESSGPHQLRQLFAIILTSCEPATPTSLWDKHCDNLTEDLFCPYETPLNPQIYNACLLLIEDMVLKMGGKPLDNYGLNVVHSTQEYNMVEYTRYTQYSVEEQLQFLADNEAKLTDEQREIYQSFCSRVDTAQAGIVFLDAPGGTGKTFLLNLILAKIRSQQKVAIATASSGIA
jgi:hypothetical protein